MVDHIYIDSPNWIKNKKATVNLINNKDKCFQYAITNVLNYEEIKKVHVRIKIKQIQLGRNKFSIRKR